MDISEAHYLTALMELHRNLPRQGPGDRESTLKALSLIPDLPVKPAVLDIGCGTGAQTLDLLSAMDCTVTAVDLFDEFLQNLRRRAAERGIQNRLKTLPGDMTDLDFPPESFDLIWSEGAIYIMGFREGLHQWKPLLKRGGCIAVTDIGWLKQGQPAELKAYWDREYPGITAIDEHFTAIRDEGYTIKGHFTLPESSWWETYYNPLLHKAETVQNSPSLSPVMNIVIRQTREEIELYRQYSAWYGYVFYVMQS